MERRVITATEPMAAYSPGIVAEGKTLYVAGQGPFRDGAEALGTIEEETRLTLENLLSVLAAAGTGPENVVRCNVYLADVADFEAMNAVYASVFPAPLPARTTIGCQLIGEIKVEIDCVALVP